MDRNNRGQFEKGHQGFKPKGVKHNLSLRSKVNEFLSKNWGKMEADFESLTDAKDRLTYYERLMQYGLPKLQSTDYASEVISQIESLPDEQLTILIEQVKILLSDGSNQGNDNLLRLFNGGESKMKLPSWCENSNE